MGFFVNVLLLSVKRQSQEKKPIYQFSIYLVLHAELTWEEAPRFFFLLWMVQSVRLHLAPGSVASIEFITIL